MSGPQTEEDEMTIVEEIAGQLAEAHQQPLGPHDLAIQYTGVAAEAA